MISCYQIEEVLGRGGFAVTYLAIDLNLDVHVAIKEYLPREITSRDEQLNVSARSPEFVEDYNIGLSNFAREAKTLARFKHLNIVRVHQVIHKYNTAYMVMDYEHGQELAEVLDGGRTLEEDDLKEILFPILDGIEEIHRHGLAHRDIKPSNIYLRDNGSPVLLDFGAARYTMSETTQQLTAVVTVGYTPIEQYNVSDNDQGPWSDIYALAAVLYEAVTGEMPVDSVTRASSTLTTASDPLTPIGNKVQQHYSEDFLRAIDWGLYMEAEDRPQSIEQWRDAFKGTFKPASAYTPKRPAGRPSRLKTRASYPAHNHDRIQPATDIADQHAAHGNDYPGPQTPPPDDQHSDPLAQQPDDQYIETDEPRLSVDVTNNRFDSRFDDELDDIEIIPLNPSDDSTITDDMADDYTEPEATQAQQPLTRLTPPRIKSRTPEPLTRTAGFTRPPRATKPAPHASEPTPGTQNIQPPRASEPPVALQPPRASTTAPMTPPRATASSAFASNPANINTAVQPQQHEQQTPRAAAATDPDATAKHPEHQQRNDDFDSPEALETLQTVANESGQTTHTQELRNVLRRDIMKREPPAAPPVDNGTPPPLIKDTNDNSHTRLQPGVTGSTPLGGSQGRIQLAAEEALRRAPNSRSDIEFDDSDWDYEPPSTPSIWRWLLPACALVAVVAGSLVFVNKPELFKLPRSVPELTVAGALEKAQQKIDSDALIFPAGGSALDYYQLILTSDPANRPATEGVRKIEAEVKRRIITNIEGDNLAEANRLLSRANDAGLQIDGLADTASTSPQTQTNSGSFSSGAQNEVLTGDDAAQWLNDRLQEIDQLIESGDLVEAEYLFNDTDKYIADAELSQSIFDRIAAAKNPPAARPDPAPGNAQPAAQMNAAESPAASQNPAAGNQPQQPQRQTATTTNSDTRPTVTITEQTLPSAPSQSYIEGSGSTTRHLNQLRTAIERKDLGRVIEISDSLAEERKDFLRSMFQRYDRLDVTIDNIDNRSGAVTASLGVAMFNQRSDGSYYSAGKWNGVTLATDQQNGTWQKIRW